MVYFDAKQQEVEMIFYKRINNKIFKKKILSSDYPVIMRFSKDSRFYFDVKQHEVEMVFIETLETLF